MIVADQHLAAPFNNKLQISFTAKCWFHVELQVALAPLKQVHGQSGKKDYS